MFPDKNEFTEEYENEAKRLKWIIEEDFQPHLFIAIVFGGKLYDHNYNFIYFIIPVILIALHDIKKKGGLKIDMDLLVDFSIKIGLLILFYALCFFSIYLKNKTLVIQYAIFLPFYMYSYYKSCRGDKNSSSYY